ncbi:MAG: PDZ domain-containing protein [Firmicutes bacterium]|nr:PDZ domain-containing protein [Bacillota bacterium]
MNASRRRLFSCLVLAVLMLGAAQLYISRNYITISPGIAENLRYMVTVDGGQKGSTGAFLLTAVSSGKASILSPVEALVKPYIDIVPIEQEIPRGVDMQKYLHIMESMMLESQMIAKAVALKKMGYDFSIKTDVKVEEVLRESPTRGKIRIGDRITAVDHKPIRTAQETIEMIQKRRVGEPVTLTIYREGREFELTVPTIRHQENREKAAIGVIIAPYVDYEFPVKIDIKAGEIKGSSAGSMFVLEILDQMKREDLTRGYIIAGTGTINIDGNIGPIAGVEQKVVAAEREGAEIFFAPEENADAARKAARSARVVAVKNIDEVLKYIMSLPRRESRPPGEY